MLRLKVVSARNKPSGTEKMVYEKRSEDTWINEEGGLTEDTKKKIVVEGRLFMVEVIDSTAQTERRTEKIQIIIMAAERFLEIKGLKCEDIRKSLNTESQSSQGWWVG